MSRPSDFWPIWKDLLTVLEAPEYATTLGLLHAIYVGFLFRSSHSYQPNRIIRSIFCCCLIGLGGGTLAAILTGKPVNWLLNNEDLLLYTTGYFLVNSNPYIYPLLKSIRPITEGLLDLVDAILRAQVLIKFQSHLRHLSPSTTTVPQILLGTLSVTGGGILYSWCFSPRHRFQYPGHDFSIVFLVNAFYAYTVSSTNRKALSTLLWSTFPMQRIQAMGYAGHVTSGWKEAMAGFAQACKVVGIPTSFVGKKGEVELRMLCALLMLVGFLARPGGWGSVGGEKEAEGVHGAGVEESEDEGGQEEDAASKKLSSSVVRKGALSKK
ncbi:hypothetical protein HDU98_003265 [Podochytrium sp. JEL0797]|nr:hypothetical protein HDU98_003265 [Podochytrium sp. JEL0797]